MVGRQTLLLKKTAPTVAEQDALLIPSILLDRASSSHPAVVCADNHTVFSYADLARMAEDLATALRQQVHAQDRVAILLPTSIEFVAAFFGILGADAIAVPLDIHLKRADLLAIMRLTRPRVLITNSALYRKIGAHLQQSMICLLEFNHSQSVRFVDSGESNTDGEGGVRVPFGDTARPQANSPENDAVFILSSGTTGLPKAVRLSHRAIMRNVSMHLESLYIDEGIRGLQWLPMNYSYGLIASFLSILHAGGTAVLLSTLEPESVLAAINQYDINLVMGTPALFQYLLEKSPANSVSAASPVRYITIGGDRCKRYALGLICDRFPSARVYLTYGLTEAGPRVSTLPHRLVKELPQSVGLPLRGVAVFVFGDSGARCAPREIGEIVVQTPSLMSGYFGDLERTQRIIRDGLCHTGDFGYLDERGFLFCLGRKDRQFKFGGRMVNPSLIEQCLASHPLVREVAVTKIENEREELICAKIKANYPRQEGLVTELRRLCRRHMPSYMTPGEFRFEDHDHYYHKGRILNPKREPLPEEPLCERL
jgi:acyl-CoA synthetase (AMP-forming)/AMP-acid ligase II